MLFAAGGRRGARITKNGRALCTRRSKPDFVSEPLMAVEGMIWLQARLAASRKAASVDFCVPLPQPTTTADMSAQPSRSSTTRLAWARNGVATVGGLIRPPVCVVGASPASGETPCLGQCSGMSLDEIRLGLCVPELQLPESAGRTT